MLLPARKIAAALSAGCSVISRPASGAPGSAMAIGKALVDAGLPAGFLSILTGRSTPMVAQLIASPVIRKVSLTGSVPVGKEIRRQCADSVKKVAMEPGGHAPDIVCPDADPVAAAEKLAAAKFRNCRQVCISPSRVHVHEDIPESFSAAFVAYAKGLKLGEGLDETVNADPVIGQRALDGALDLVEDAKAKGGRRSGRRAALGGL